MPKEELKNQLLKELDELFDGRASKLYMKKYLVQNWSEERLARGDGRTGEQHEGVQRSS